MPPFSEHHSAYFGWGRIALGSRPSGRRPTYSLLLFYDTLRTYQQNFWATSQILYIFHKLTMNPLRIYLHCTPNLHCTLKFTLHDRLRRVRRVRLHRVRWYALLAKGPIGYLVPNAGGVGYPALTAASCTLFTVHDALSPTGTCLAGAGRAGGTIHGSPSITCTG